ncbi:hypothetical protein AN641_04675 [Candidatus Epulonipiscioides gigas]|nr:hypothetical protein AN641_04675 [Epulopiscium sp. SCG-C07WGA-EpuloA2]
MKLTKILGTTLITALTIGAFTACGSSEETAQTEVKETVQEEVKKEQKIEAVKETAPAEPVEVIEEEPARDLGGRHITIATWVDVLEPEEKSSAQEEALWEWRHEMMEKHNFTIEEKAVSTWNGTLELMTTSMLAGDPAAEIFHVSSSFVSTVIQNNLAYDLATLDSLDIDHWKWDEAATGVLTRGDSVYGIFPDQTPGNFIFYNKRLFEEAGLDPNLPYDLQASGEWTWEKFEEISEKLSRDVDGDGINDTYATNTNSALYNSAVLSNGGLIVSMDEDGTFVNNLLNSETIEALEWADQYLKKDYDLAPKNWNGHETLFITGQIAMIMHDKDKLLLFQDMEDDFGMVAFPKGPKADKYVFSGTGAGWFIPNTYTKEESEDIAFAMDIWASAPPGYDAEDDWKMADYKLFRDDRAVDETMAMTKEKDGVQLDYRLVFPGINLNDLNHQMMYENKTVVEAAETIKPVFDAAIEKANADK